MSSLRTIIVRGVAIAMSTIAILAAAIIGTWVWQGGASGALSAAWRELRYGTTTVYDFQRYPGRKLDASAAPLPFRAAKPGVAAPPMVASGDGRTLPLAELLASTDTLAFLVIQDDAIVFEHYAADHGVAVASQYFSVSKSILATLVGMAIDDGLIHSIDDSVTDYVPELVSSGFSTVTLRQLINMSADLAYKESDNPFGLHVLMNYTSRLEQLILTFRLRGSGANQFEYRSGESALLSLALKRALGAVSMTTYAQRRLWTPLGMEHPATWSLDREYGMEKAWCCIAGTARDLAKVGRLYLDRGFAGGRRLLSEAWISDSTPKPPTAAGVGRVYTFSWWPVSPQGVDFMAVGKDGQFLYVDPMHRAVVVRLGRSSGWLSKEQWGVVFGTVAAHAPW